jgi:LEA14-like dessication related protein
MPHGGLFTEASPQNAFIVNDPEKYPDYHYMRLWYLPLAAALVLSCAAAPDAVSPELPSASLAFDRVEARDPRHMALYFFLKLENPRPVDARVEIRDWTLTMNGVSLETGVDLSEDTLLAPHSSGVFSLRLDPDLAGIYAGTDYRAELALDLDFGFDSGEAAPVRVRTEAAFPRIREPQFNITSIAIMKAELINTRFKVKLRIDNPNAFPVELSSFSYELYGAGRFWADGKETDILDIPAEGSAERELFLRMNFINMKRDLLDQVIALRRVNYRFAGEATVSTGVEYLPSFLMAFDRSGYSAVLE